jgi:2-isopropylmalate synthase
MSKIKIPKNYIHVTDTTLRDGAQTKGVNFSTKQRIEMAHMFTDAGIDMIEAGFPASKPDQEESIRIISEEVDVPYLMALTRMDPREIDQTWRSICKAKQPVIHTWVGTSPTHRKKFNKSEGISKSDLSDWIDKTVRYTKSVVGTHGFVQWSPEDAFRTELDYLTEVISIAVEAGADFINVPDTVGYAVPEEIAFVFSHLYKNVPGIDDVVVKFHPHNDMGNAIENSFVAFNSGVQAIESTINGLGERTGNVDLVQILGRLHTRSDHYDFKIGFDLGQLRRIAKTVSRYSGKPIPHNSPFVGECAAHHESGVHRSGARRVREAYEIVDLSVFGSDLKEAEQDSLGPMSGKSNVIDLSEKLGYKDLQEDEVQKLYDVSMRLLDIEGKNAVYADELKSLIDDYIRASNGPYQLIYWDLSSGSGRQASVALQLSINGKNTQVVRAMGDGPVDAAKKAINEITGLELDIADFGINVIGQKGGSERMGRAWMVLRENGNTYNTIGISTDIDEASARAYVNGLNRREQAYQQT